MNEEKKKKERLIQKNKNRAENVGAKQRSD